MRECWFIFQIDKHLNLWNFTFVQVESRYTLTKSEVSSSILHSFWPYFPCILPLPHPTDTHIWSTIFRRDFDAANSPRYRAGFAPMLFQWCYSHMARFSSRIRCDFFTARFFRSRPLFIARFLFCRAIFHVQTGWALLFVLQLIVLLFVLQ